MSTGRTLAALVAAAALVLTACGSQEASDTDSSGGSSGGSGSKLTFTATTLDGKQFDAATLEGEPAVFWFWAPWCSTCAAEAPHVSKLASKHENVNVVGVASLGQPSEMNEFVQRTDTADLTHLNDEAGAVWRHFGITAQSTFALVDASGAVTYTGYLGPDELNDRVADLAA